MDHFRSIKYAFKVASHILNLVAALVTVVIMLCCCSCSVVVLQLYCTTVLLLVVARPWPHDRSVGGPHPVYLNHLNHAVFNWSLPDVRLEAGTRTGKYQQATFYQCKYINSITSMMWPEFIWEFIARAENMNLNIWSLNLSFEILDKYCFKYLCSAGES